ncbi:MAG TPA: leucyl aminopeptidase [Vicinamibacterales bacterium]|nr:leucyl aminopeptidase [Vicinamibacterales bacterium]
MSWEPVTSTSTFVASTSSPGEIDTDLICVPVFQGADDLDDVVGLDKATGGAVGRARSSGEFRGKVGTIFTTPVVTDGWRARRVALVGAGRREDYDPERQRQVAAACAYQARRVFASTLALVVRPSDEPLRAAQMGADGLSAAEFLVTIFKQNDDAPGPFPERVTVVVSGVDGSGLAEAVKRGRVIGESANIARALANEPPNVLTPREFASRGSKYASRCGVSVEVLDEHRIRELRMRLLLGVAQGSAEPPRVLVLRYEPKREAAGPVLGLVGKGVTFDTGGISIKPADGMDRMKYDMSGGAAVVGAMCAIGRLGAARRVIGIVPMTENMPGSKATRPSDVLTGANGKTVEVTNTDAEGRLILADALWYATELGATHLVDVATLTGACMVALGHHVSGLMGTPAAWAGLVGQAAGRAGDRVWELPIYREAREQMRSEIADLVNSAGRPGGAITAAAFLREFTGGKAWAHLDIAGTAWAEKAEAHQPKGPTGVAVRTLIELATTADYPTQEREG